MSRSMNRLLILLLGLFTAIVHLVILNLGGLKYQLNYFFVLNGLAYLTLLAAFWFKFPKGQERLVHYAYMAFALVTIIAWVFLGKPYTPLGYVTKTVEILLIIFLWLDLKGLSAPAKS